MTEAIKSDVLVAVIERIERLEEEKKAKGDDIRDVYAEAKANGFDPKIIRKVISLRKLDKEEREELTSLVEMYMAAAEK